MSGIWVNKFFVVADGRLSRDEVVSGWKSGHCDFRDPADGLLIFLESDLDRDFFVTDADLDQLFNKFDSGKVV